MVYSDFSPSVSFLFSSLIRTGINEIQTVLATTSQSSEVNRNGNLPIANTAVSEVARSERR